MKKLPFVFCIALIIVGIAVQRTPGQADEALRKRIELVKKLTNFTNWPPETGRVISGVAISEKTLPQLTNLRKVWRQDNYSLERIQEATYVRIRKWWRMEKDEFEVMMVVGASFDAAKEYLVRRYAETQSLKPIIKPPGREFGLKIGNVCFATKGEKDRSFSSIDFIRDNVLIMIRAEGRVQTSAAKMAQILDRLLLKKKPVKKYGSLSDLPKIAAFSSKRAAIKLGQEVPLRLQVESPTDRQLRYFWTMTAGGVKKGFVDDFVYQGTEEGKQRLTVTVVNDVGLYSSRSVDIEVARP